MCDRLVKIMSHWYLQPRGRHPSESSWREAGGIYGLRFSCSTYIRCIRSKAYLTTTGRQACFAAAPPPVSTHWRSMGNKAACTYI